MSSIKKLFQLSVIKTLRLNIHYFGWKNGWHFYILASRNLKIQRMKGQINFLNPPKTGIICLGFPHTGIFDQKYERSIWDNIGVIQVGGKISLYQGARISNSGTLQFHGNFSMGCSTIVCEKEIDFGNDIVISWDVLLMDTDFHKIYIAENMEKIINQAKKIQVHDHVWIGCRCTILKGSEIPSGTVIAANSCISGEIKGENLLVSDKKKILKENIIWKD